MTVLYHVLLNLIFFIISFSGWQNLQWQFGPVWFVRMEVLPDVTPRALILWSYAYTHFKMSIQPKPMEHTMPDNNEEVQKDVEERTGT